MPHPVFTLGARALWRCPDFTLVMSAQYAHTRIRLGMQEFTGERVNELEKRPSRLDVIPVLKALKGSYTKPDVAMSDSS